MAKPAAAAASRKYNPLSTSTKRSNKITLLIALVGFVGIVAVTLVLTIPKFGESRDLDERVSETESRAQEQEAKLTQLQTTGTSDLDAVLNQVRKLDQSIRTIPEADASLAKLTVLSDLEKWSASSGVVLAGYNAGDAAQPDAKEAPSLWAVKVTGLKVTGSGEALTQLVAAMEAKGWLVTVDTLSLTAASGAQREYTADLSFWFSTLAPLATSRATNDPAQTRPSGDPINGNDPVPVR